MLFSGGIHLTNPDGTPMPEPIYGFANLLGDVAVIKLQSPASTAMISWLRPFVFWVNTD